MAQEDPSIGPVGPEALKGSDTVAGCLPDAAQGAPRLHKVESFVRVPAAELDPGSPVSTSGATPLSEAGSASSLAVAAPGRDAPAAPYPVDTASGCQSCPTEKPSGAEMGLGPEVRDPETHNRTGDRQDDWGALFAKAFQDIASHTMEAVAASQRLIAHHQSSLDVSPTSADSAGTPAAVGSGTGVLDGADSPPEDTVASRDSTTAEAVAADIPAAPAAPANPQPAGNETGGASSSGVVSAAVGVDADSANADPVSAESAPIAPAGAASGAQALEDENPLAGLQSWAVEAGANISHAVEEQAEVAKAAWEGFVSNAHLAFAAEFLPVALWPTEPKGPQLETLSSALTVTSEDRFVTGSQDCSIRVWHAGNGMLIRQIMGHKEAVRCLAVIPRGRVVSGSLDKTLRVWDLAEGKKLFKLKGHTAAVRALVAFCLGGPCLVASASDDGAIRVWDVDHGCQQYALMGHSGPVSTICLLPDERLVSGSWDKLVVTWSLASGVAERIMEGHQAPILAVSQASRGRVLSSSLDRRIRLWITASGVCERVFDFGRPMGATALACLDSTRFVECTGDGWLRIWNMDSGACIRSKKAHVSGIYCAAIFGDEARPKLLTASSDKSAGIWDTDELDLDRLLMSGGGGMDSVWAVAFVPAGL